MNTIAKQLNYKPSAALRAMRDGLKTRVATGNFRVDMSSFGYRSSSKEGVCFGCAATCAVDFITGGQNIKTILKENTTLARLLRTDGKNKKATDLSLFEGAIDSARRGSLRHLFYYMGVGDKWQRSYDDLFYLSSEDWKEGLPAVTALAKKLARKGL